MPAVTTRGHYKPVTRRDVIKPVIDTISIVHAAAAASRVTRHRSDVFLSIPPISPNRASPRHG